jgi:hypothetical protein
MKLAKHFVHRLGDRLEDGLRLIVEHELDPVA